MKKILSLIFLSLLTLALVACGGKKEEATKEGGETKQEAIELWNYNYLQVELYQLVKMVWNKLQMVQIGY